MRASVFDALEAGVPLVAGGVLTGYTSNEPARTRERTASTNACPVGPTPGGSPVPRANTTSTSGHPRATARGTAADGSTDASAIPTNPTTKCTRTFRIPRRFGPERNRSAPFGRNGPESHCWWLTSTPRRLQRKQQGLRCKQVGAIVGLSAATALSATSHQKFDAIEQRLESLFELCGAVILGQHRL